MNKLTLLILFILVYSIHFIQAKEVNQFSFWVAGHSYGAHAGGNIGLHPPFLKKLSENMDSTIFALFLTGDIVNYSTEESWNKVATELENLGINSYYVMGNHDNNALGHLVFNEKHGGTYYSFSYHNQLFIVLNSTLKDRSISQDQLEFLQNCLDNAGQNIQRVFLFFHEVLWNSHDQYKNVLSNSRSRYNQIKPLSNYWIQVHPLLIAFRKDVFIFAGDVAGNTDAIPAFYDKWDNVTFIASGMGEVEDENYLIVSVIDDSVSMELIPLKENIDMKPIEFYALPDQPDTIYGYKIVAPGMKNVDYTISEIFNATSIHWTLSDGMTGMSSSHLISVDFSDKFKCGAISVQTEHTGFGLSEPKSLMVESDQQNFVAQFDENYKINWKKIDDRLIVDFSDFLFEKVQIELMDITGKRFYHETFVPDGFHISGSIGIQSLPMGTYFLVAIGQKFTEIHRVMIP